LVSKTALPALASPATAPDPAVVATPVAADEAGVPLTVAPADGFTAVGDVAGDLVGVTAVGVAPGAQAARTATSSAEASMI